MRTIAILASCLAAAGCGKNKDATPAGSTVLDWDLSRTDRAAMKSATMADKKAADVDQVLDAAEDAKVKLKLHIETATVHYEENGKPLSLPALVGIKATVVDGNDFTFHDGKCRGPNYPGLAPTTTIVDCIIRTNKPRYDVSVSFQVDGDGHISTGGNGPTIILKP